MIQDSKVEKKKKANISKIIKSWCFNYTENI